ncbi:hypothetical protein ACSSS7_002254 [Eimeria intestinalis]
MRRHQPSEGEDTAFDRKNTRPAAGGKTPLRLHTLFKKPQGRKRSFDSETLEALARLWGLRVHQSSPSSLHQGERERGRQIRPQKGSPLAPPPELCKTRKAGQLAADRRSPCPQRLASNARKEETKALQRQRLQRPQQRALDQGPHHHIRSRRHPL